MLFATSHVQQACSAWLAVLWYTQPAVICCCPHHQETGSIGCLHTGAAARTAVPSVLTMECFSMSAVLKASLVLRRQQTLLLTLLRGMHMMTNLTPPTSKRP